MLIAGAPDHVLHIAYTAVSQNRQAIFHPHDAWYILDSGVDQVLRFYSDQWRCTV